MRARAPQEAPSVRRFVTWSGVDAWRAEGAKLELSSEALRAEGTQLGVEPLPYRLDYRLEAVGGFVTRRFAVHATGEGWTRSIELERAGGAWVCEARSDGDVRLPPPGGDTAGLGEAFDCDLGLSPLTNLMPIRRHALHERAGAADLVMAWVSVPDLGLHRSPQRYEHVGWRAGASLVRYLDRGTHSGFTAELELDGDGVALLYPGLARRVSVGAAPAATPASAGAG